MSGKRFMNAQLVCPVCQKTVATKEQLEELISRAKESGGLHHLECQHCGSAWNLEYPKGLHLEDLEVLNRKIGGSHE